MNSLDLTKIYLNIILEDTEAKGLNGRVGALTLLNNFDSEIEIENDEDR